MNWTAIALAAMVVGAVVAAAAYSAGKTAAATALPAGPRAGADGWRWSQHAQAWRGGWGSYSWQTTWRPWTEPGYPYHPPPTPWQAGECCPGCPCTPMHTEQHHPPAIQRAPQQWRHPQPAARPGRHPAPQPYRTPGGWPPSTIWRGAGGAEIGLLLANHDMFTYNLTVDQASKTIVWTVNAKDRTLAEALANHIESMRDAIMRGATPRPFDPLYKLYAELARMGYIDTSIEWINTTALRITVKASNDCALRVALQHASIVENLFKYGHPEAQRIHEIPEETAEVCKPYITG